MLLLLLCISADGLSGIYLPLIHPVSSCCPYPVVIAVDSQTGAPLPLVTAQTSSSAAYEMVVPLCSCDLEALQVRCLLDDERAASLLECYLRLTEVPCTKTDGITVVPTAR